MSLFLFFIFMHNFLHKILLFWSQKKGKLILLFTTSFVSWGFYEKILLQILEICFENKLAEKWLYIKESVSP